MSISSTIVSGAEVRFREADKVLQPYVGCFWVITAERNATIRVVPDGSTTISIQIEDGRSSGWMLRGPLVQPDERRFTSPTTLIGIRLKPGAAFIVSDIPAHTIVGCRISVNSFPHFRELVTASIGSESPDEYIDALERFLIKRLAQATVNEAVAQAILEIEREHGLSRVSEIAARCGMSPRHLNRLMHDWVGYSTKRFADIIRFQSTLHQIDRAPAQTGALLASETGFFDQSHLTHAMGRFAGDTPRHLAGNSVSDFSKTRCDDGL